jgi:hypothetical protein
LHDAAVVNALASVAERLTPSGRQAAVDRTIELLRRVLAGDPAFRKDLIADPKFRPFRLRPDFQALLADK